MLLAECACWRSQIAKNWNSTFWQKVESHFFSNWLCSHGAPRNSARSEYYSLHWYASKTYCPPTGAWLLLLLVEYGCGQDQTAKKCSPVFLKNLNFNFMQSCSTPMHETQRIILNKTYLCYDRIKDTFGSETPPNGSVMRMRRGIALHAPL